VSRVAEDRGAPRRPPRDDRHGPGPRPFRPLLRPEPPPLLHTLRLREGDREVEVSGSAVFVRQALDDLPSLLAKLHGEPSPQPQSIRMPAPRPAAAHRIEPPEAAPRGSTADGNGSFDERVLSVLRDADRPLAVAAIRKRLGSNVTPQQVRSALERARDRIITVNNRPATYRIAER